MTMEQDFSSEMPPPYDDDTGHNYDSAQFRTEIDVEPPRKAKVPPPIEWTGAFQQTRDGTIVRQVEAKDPETREPYFKLVPIGGPVKIIALTSGPSGEACIRLRWADFRSIDREADVPFAALSSLRSNFLHEQLIGRGLRLVPGKERDFCDALRSVRVNRVIRSLDRSGWCDLNAAPIYADPAGRIYGEADGSVTLATPSAAPGMFEPVGTFEGWNAAQGRLAQGNSRLVFFVAAALAGPLLRPVGEASGAFHLVGLSGDGKSTALRLAGSVWGGPAHVGTWRSTANGWEATCAQASDSILIADELSQANPKDAAAVVFMVGNESGARRMTKALDAQAVRTWKTLLLSAGEETLEDMLRRDRQEFRGGLETRFLTIPSDAGKGFRVYDRLPADFTSDNALSVALARACREHAGHVGPAFLNRLLAELRADREGFLARWTAYRDRFLRCYAGEGADGPMLRACSKFALVGFAGECGIGWDTLPWPAGHAEWAAAECWGAWVRARGHTGDTDTAQAIEALRSYLTAHGLSRFPLLSDGTAQHWERLPDHAGFRRAVDGGVEYLMNPTTWRDLLRGKSPTMTAKRLSTAGLYRRERRKINGLAQIEYHVISGRLLED